jgi:hypothetical protein
MNDVAGPGSLGDHVHEHTSSDIKSEVQHGLG